MTGQMYVERLTPPIVTQIHPVVFIHGGGQTGTNFLDTPDGRPGWASFFLERGYVVYLSDQPARGRSPWQPTNDAMMKGDAGAIERIFTATSTHELWPQSKLHTQWPGTGKVGDPIFDAFYAAQVPLEFDFLASEAQSARAYVALLDKIGAAHLVTHSQSGSHGWLVGDRRPTLVKSIVALEPTGPPFVSSKMFPGQDRAWGITHLEVTYEPSAGLDGSLLERVIVPAKDTLHSEGVMQREPAKKLEKLSQVPILIVTAEASYHAPYDSCTVAYLRQAGVKVEHLELAEEGIHGNGHMFFMEKNNKEIAEKVLNWLGKQ